MVFSPPLPLPHLNYNIHYDVQNTHMMRSINWYRSHQLDGTEDPWASARGALLLVEVWDVSGGVADAGVSRGGKGVESTLGCSIYMGHVEFTSSTRID